MDKVICIEKDGSSFGIGDNIEEAFNALKNDINYSVEIDDIIFYEATKIKVKQQLIKIEND